MTNIFGKGDIRRTLSVVAVIAELQPITLNQLVVATGMPKGTVQEQLKKFEAGQLPGISLVKNGSAYGVTSDDKIVKLINLKKWYKTLDSDC
jgi:predicted transcriptional regulator